MKKVLYLLLFMVFCANVSAQNTVVRRNNKTSRAQKTTKKKSKIIKEADQSPQQADQPAVQQLEMPNVVDNYLLQSAPSEYNCPPKNVRKEDVVTVGGQHLHSFNVVVGNFATKSNAIGMYLALQNQGFHPSIAYSGTKFYRVILGTSDSLRDAIYWLEKCRSIYPGCWILYNEQ